MIPMAKPKFAKVPKPPKGKAKWSKERMKEWNDQVKKYENLPKPRLPDINTSVIRIRNKAVDSWKQGKIDPCYEAIYSLNALLPLEYRTEIKLVSLSSENSFTSWFWQTLMDIERKMADFRNDNWTRKE